MNRTKGCDFLTANQITVKLVRSVPYQDGPGWNYPVNFYPYNTLYFVLGGDGHIQVEDTHLLLRTGFAYLIPANTLFRCWCGHSIHKLYVDVNVEVVPGYDLFAGLGAVKEIPFPVADTLRMIEASENGSLKGMLYLKAEVTRALSLFMDEDFQLSGKGILQFGEILSDIDRHLSSQLKIAEIARAHNWNPTVLSRNFKKVFHCSLKSYVERLLLRRIKQELLVTDKSVKELAAEYQFCDPYYLSNFFKRNEGRSPLQYRRENQLRPGISGEAGSGTQSEIRFESNLRKEEPHV